jgi:hypothetical protein
VAADALMVAHGLESYDLNLAMRGLADVEALLNSIPFSEQYQLILTFIDDFFANLSGGH